MTFQGDPYRTLGIGPGASLNEIKSAYRRLVKQYHPDAAGERALPRFLAIQAAYERLVDGEGRLRPPGSTGGPARTAPPAEPWRADPNRARASRDAWRARRSTGSTRTGASSAGGPAQGGSGWATPGAGSRRARGTGSETGAGTGAGQDRTQDAGAAGSPPGAGARADGGHRERHAKRGPRKATPGSTTYDEAAELPLDPEWDGGAWYGPSSGTFWTINPREYADPRKHGPEYLARARRAVRRERSGAAADPVVDDAVSGAGDDPEQGAERPRWGWAGEDATTTQGGAGWGTRAWHYDDPEIYAAAAAGGATASGARPGRAASRTERTVPDPDGELPDLESIARRASPRSLLALARRPDRRWLLLLALIGWPPIGFAVGTLLGALTGCGSFAATCPEPLSMLPLVLQPLIIVGLLLVPPVAAVAAFASIVAVAVAVPFAAVFAVGSLPESRTMSPVLGVVAVVAYFVGLAVGVRAIWRASDGRGEADPAP